jgi:hypothetical protein
MEERRADNALQWMRWRTNGEPPVSLVQSTAFRVAPWTRHSSERVSAQQNAPLVSQTTRKLCPGRQCNSSLPLSSFAPNSNMPDGLDVYCSACNQRRRGERRGRVESVVIDKFELWSRKQTAASTPEDPERASMQELHRRIAASVKDAELTLGRELKLEPTELSRKLLMRHRFVCTLTGRPLTVECFLSHHSLRFSVIAADVGGAVRSAVQVSCTNTYPVEATAVPPVTIDDLDHFAIS